MVKNRGMKKENSSKILSKKKKQEKDLNLRPLDYETNALNLTAPPCFY